MEIKTNQTIYNYVDQHPNFFKFRLKSNTKGQPLVAYSNSKHWRKKLPANPKEYNVAVITGKPTILRLWI